MPPSKRTHRKRRRLPHAGPPLAPFCAHTMQMIEHKRVVPELLRRPLENLKRELAAVLELEGEQNRLRNDLRIVSQGLASARRVLRNKLVSLDQAAMGVYGQRTAAFEGAGLPAFRKPGPRRRRRPRAQPVPTRPSDE